MRTILTVCLLASTLFAHSLVLNEEQRLWIDKHQNVAYTGDPNWLPFEAFDDKGNYIGIVSEHLKLIEKRTGLSFETKIVNNWTESLKLATEGKVSVISGDIADVILNRDFRPIEPYLISPVIIIMDHHANYVDDLNKLADKKIAIIKSYGYTSEVFKQYPQIKFIEVENIQEGLNGVDHGDFDAMLASEALAQYSINAMGLEKLKIVGKTPVVMEVTLFVDKEKPLLYSIINKAMKSISTQEQQSIYHKWTNTPEAHDINSALTWSILLLIGILVFILFLNYKRILKNEKDLAYMEKLVSAQEVGHMGSWQWNMLTGELIWSDEVYRIFGEKPQAFPATYERFKSYIPEEYHSQLEKAIDNSIKTGEPYEFDHLIRKKDGTIRSVREAGYVRFNDAGEPISMLGTVLDINSIVLAKSTLRQNEELSELLEKYDINVIASNTDLKGNITYASQAFCKISGYTYNELIGQPHSIVRHPDNPVEIYKEMWDTIKSGRTWRGSLRNRRKNGTCYWVESMISPIYNAQDEVIGYSSIRRDITHEKKVEELHQQLEKKSIQLQELNAELEERIENAVALSKEKDHMLAQQNKLAAMGEMIGNIAHQWRQPLNALALLLQKQQAFYERGKLTEEKLKESVQKGTALINKMSMTIDDFRDFFKPNKEKIDFDIEHAVNETIGLIDAALYNNNITVDVNLEESNIVHGYKNEFSQVILNLVNNAKDVLVEKKTQHPAITIDAHRQGDMVKIRVSDNGGGIPQDIIEHIFEPYFTTKEEGKGTGIGLYMSKMIIEGNMDGTLEVENSDKGAVFTISLKSQQ